MTRNLLKIMTNCSFQSFFPRGRWWRGSWSDQHGAFRRGIRSNIKEKYCSVCCNICSSFIWGKTIKYGSLWISGIYCTRISTEEKGGRNRGRRKVDISTHVGWELVGRGALYLTCGERQNQSQWVVVLYRSLIPEVQAEFTLTTERLSHANLPYRKIIQRRYSQSISTQPSLVILSNETIQPRKWIFSAICPMSSLHCNPFRLS